MINDPVQPLPESQSETTSDIHTYKAKPRQILLGIFSLLVAGTSVGFALVLIITLVVSSFKSGMNNGVLPYIFLCVFTPLIISLGYAFIQLMLSVFSPFFSYIRIDQNGIENRVWPYRHIRSRWAEVDRLDRFFFYDFIYLNSYKVMGFSLSFTWLFKFFNRSQIFISLSSYIGWPNGQLAADLKRHAPHLFENRPVAEKTQGLIHDSNVSVINQEVRLLAALSHASVLLNGIGIFVPIVIYFTQRKKSVYLAFQAMQSFFFQLIGNLFGFLLPFCLIGVVYVSTFGAPLSEAENVIESVMPAILAITILMVFGSFAYIIYGIIGAIRAYQGKDFRYAIIGKRLQRYF